MALAQKLVWIGVLLLATLATGFWRGNAGNPGLPEVLHKLLGLAWVVYTLIVVFHLGRPAQSRGAFFSAIAVLVVSMAALIASGSVLAVPKPASPLWLNLHRIASAVAVVASWFGARLILLNRH